MYIGTISEHHLLSGFTTREALEGERIEPYLRRETPLSDQCSGAAALRFLESEERSECVVVTSEGLYRGVVHLRDLVYPDTSDQAYPRTVGGMATPFGVYLSDGINSGGVSPWALASTGATLYSLFAIALVTVDALTSNLSVQLLQNSFVSLGIEFCISLLFLSLMRSLPLTGIHAAEHMVVHAMERGIELTTENVRRMPRVHPRCGTNLAAGLMVFTTAFGLISGLEPSIAALLALALAAAVWRPFGAFLQRVFTTKPPNDAQIKQSISAAQDLQRKLVGTEHLQRTFASSMLRSGLFQIILGSMSAALLLGLVAQYVPFLAVLKVY